MGFKILFIEDKAEAIKIRIYGSWKLTVITALVAKTLTIEIFVLATATYCRIKQYDYAIFSYRYSLYWSPQGACVAFVLNIVLGVSFISQQDSFGSKEGSSGRKPLYFSIDLGGFWPQPAPLLSIWAFFSAISCSGSHSLQIHAGLPAKTTHSLSNQNNLINLLHRCHHWPSVGAQRQDIHRDSVHLRCCCVTSEKWLKESS